MADEEKKSLTESETGDEVRPTPEYTEDESEHLPEPESGLDEAVVSGVEASEDLTDTPLVEAFDDALTSIQKATEQLEPEVDEGITDFRRPMMEGHVTPEVAAHAAAHAEMLSDTTVVFGREVTVPGGIYTVIFGFLAVATIIEVLIGGLPRGILLIPLLMGIAVVKAGLVVAYYMHLKVDPRIFLYILLVPLGISMLSMLYLLTVPPTGY
ncbi:MAG: hypothetical protein CL610_27475 [Anaerolineaceae bacterium]|nr:hypothetical protein [Anaerolineaceae bacterium]